MTLCSILIAQRINDLYFLYFKRDCFHGNRGDVLKYAWLLFSFYREQSSFNHAYNKKNAEMYGK